MRWLGKTTSFLFGFVVIMFASCGDNHEIQATENNSTGEKQQATTFIYEDDFSDSEKIKLENWINFTSECAQKVLGRYPFDLYYHFHREDSSDRAVVFGHTARTDSINAAHFYVDPTYSLDELKADWIAPHEISHLAIPKLSRKNRWFIEGFATYMSREVMIEMDVFSREEVDSINHSRIIAITENFESTSQLNFVTDSLINHHHKYPPVYWIGASFFLKANELLLHNDKNSLVDIMKEFQQCCHKTGMLINDVVDAFDQISGSEIIGDLFVHYTESPVNILLEDYKN